MESNHPRVYDVLVKVVFLGDKGSGKTSLLTRNFEGIFNEKQYPTIALDLRTKIVQLDGKRLKMQIWDISGGEMFRNLSTAYFRDTNCVLLVFDLSDKNSFVRSKTILEDIKSKRDLYNGLIILIGNKSDKIEERQVVYSEIEELVSVWDIEYLETSAKLNSNVDNMMDLIANKINSNLNKQQNFQQIINRRNLNVTSNLISQKEDVPKRKISSIQVLCPATFLLILILLSLLCQN